MDMWIIPRSSFPFVFHCWLHSYVMCCSLGLQLKNIRLQPRPRSRPRPDLQKIKSGATLVFTARCSYASAVLGVVILSVCPSVCHMRALWQNQTMHCGYFDTTRKAIILVFWHQHWLMDDAPFRVKFALKVTHPSKSADFDRFSLITSQP